MATSSQRLQQFTPLSSIPTSRDPRKATPPTRSTAVDTYDDDDNDDDNFASSKSSIQNFRCHVVLTEEQRMSIGSVIQPTSSRLLATMTKRNIVDDDKDIESFQVVPITAGAGAGKTTGILQVAAHAARSGHSHITYSTFPRASADDGKGRIGQQIVGE